MMILRNFCCPICHEKLSIQNGDLRDETGHVYPIIDGVPRFVKSAGYSENFSLQWNQFPETQIDKGFVSQSSERFWAETGWSREELNGAAILEVGSGAGRFSQVVCSESNARLHSVDYSEAVAANAKNNKEYIESGRLSLAQANVYELPFENDVFDYVFCLGVLQHTPNFRQSLHCLIEKLRPGGQLVGDFYPITGWWTKLHAKYLFRPFLKHLPAEKLLGLVKKTVPVSLALYRGLTAIGLNRLTRFLPICDVSGTLPAGLTNDQVNEWCVLDTFDMFSPAYDNPQRIKTVADWVSEFGADVTFSGFVAVGEKNRAAVVRAVKRGPDVLH